MQRMIDCGTWDDPWFADLAPDAKLLFLYLITNRRSTAAGAFEITLRAMAFETGLDAKRIQSALDGFGDRVRWWPDHQVVWVRNFYKRQAANEKFMISAQRHVADLPLDVQQAIAVVYPKLVPDGVSPDDDTHGNGYAMGISSIGIEESRDRVEEGEGENGADAPSPPPPADDPPDKSKPKRASRIPDDFEITDDMRRWAIEQGAGAIQVERETEKFLDYWRAAAGSKGVKLDWPATWRNWIRRGIDDGPRGNGSITVHQGGRNGQIGRDGRTDAERGYRLDPGPKGWSADELARMSMDDYRTERSGT